MTNHSVCQIEEELKRLHAAGYGQVGFNYEAGGEPSPAAPPAELDEPFVPTPAFQALFQPEVLLVSMYCKLESFQ